MDSTECRAILSWHESGPVMDVAALNQRLSQGCRRFGVPGAQVGLLQGDQRILLSAGLERLAGEPVSDHTPFHVGSIAKALCALIVVDAAERGELALDVPCNEQSSADWSDTPLSIMAQTTGRPNVLPGPDEDLAAFVARVAAMGKVHQPGRFSYCNAAWSVLDLLLRERVGSGFEQLAAERVLDGRTWFGEPDGASTGYALQPGREAQQVPPEMAPSASAAGSRWWATASDLLDFAGLHLNRGGGRFSPWVIDRMQQWQAAVPGHTVADGWGLGWALWRRPAHTAFGWAGFTSGHRGYLRCFPEQQAALVVLANSAGPLFQPLGGSALFDDLLPELLDALDVPALPSPDYGTATSETTELDGDYGPFGVRSDGGDALVLDAAAFGEPDPLRLLRSGGDTFEVAGHPPGAMPVAFDAGLLYLGPFAVPRNP